MTETAVDTEGIEVVRSPRARRISLTVRPDGTVRLTRPCGVSRERALAFLETKRDWIRRARERMAARRSVVPPPLSPEEERTRLEALRRAAKADLPPRVERLSAATGLRCTGLTIRSSRTKWGSCTGANRISLSLFLMLLPEHLRDYVIVHELCHTVHHDHSARFHALVDRLTGGRERALQRELRGYSIR